MHSSYGGLKTSVANKENEETIDEAYIQDEDSIKGVHDTHA